MEAVQTVTQELLIGKIRTRTATRACIDTGAPLYSQALENVVPVSSTSVAEMVKLLENKFRMINEV
jgi:UDP-N-acetyl-D-mannosaminuronate dehydrogenase